MSQTAFSLQNRDIWVIGGAGYLGQEVVKLLTQLGATVLCADLPGKARSSPQVTAADLDAADIPALENFVTAHIAARGVPHGLVVITFASTAK